MCMITSSLHSIPGNGRHERVVYLLHPRHLLELLLFLFAYDVVVSRHAICRLHVRLVVEVTLDIEAHVCVRVETGAQVGGRHPAVNVSIKMGERIVSSSVVPSFLQPNTHLSSSKRYHCARFSNGTPIEKKKGAPRPETAQNWYNVHCPSDPRG